MNMKQNNIIDLDVYDAIVCFQKLVFANVRNGLLGRSSCANLETLRDSLSLLVSDLTKRVEEFDEYINKFSV